MKIYPGRPAYLDKVNTNGAVTHNIRGTNYSLVKRDQSTGKFEHVTSLDDNVSSDELDFQYGVWRDREITKGWFWTTTIREADGIIQPDEVTSFERFRWRQSEVTRNSDGKDLEYHMTSAEIRVKPFPQLHSEWSLKEGDTRFPGWVSALAPDF